MANEFESARVSASALKTALGALAKVPKALPDEAPTDLRAVQVEYRPEGVLKLIAADAYQVVLADIVARPGGRDWQAAWDTDAVERLLAELKSTRKGEEVEFHPCLDDELSVRLRGRSLQLATVARNSSATCLLNETYAPTARISGLSVDRIGKTAATLRLLKVEGVTVYERVRAASQDNVPTPVWLTGASTAEGIGRVGVLFLPQRSDETGLLIPLHG